MKPSDFLYIYELEGTLSDPEVYFKTDFLAHWREADNTFLFFSKPQEETLKEFLKIHPELVWIRSHQISSRDWQGGEGFDEVSVGKIRFIPPWKPMTQRPGSLAIRLEPGVVFGSGHHPTTRDSLQALLWVYDQETPRRVLDLGTGSGILALASARLGAQEVLAIDWNPACVKSAGRNLELNQLGSIIAVKEGRAEEFIREPADLLIANLHFAVIQELVKRDAFFEKNWVILSGLMRSEYRAIKQKLGHPGFTLIKEWESDQTWFTLLGRNRKGL
jgi:ribosomal protein L11 methyltransferase